MPGAGFYAIDNQRLSFRSDGRWYANDEPVLHERLAKLFSRYARRKAGGGYEIWIDEQFHADIDVEDTVFVVMSVGLEGDHFSIALNDGTVELLDPSSLRVGNGNVLYCQAKGGSESVRFLRPAYYRLADCIEEAAAGEFVFRSGNKRYPIRQSAT